MTIRPDLVLVALPPREERRTDAGVIVQPDDRPAQAGIVRQVGAAVGDVAAGDRVLFSTLAGQELEVDGWPHLLLREQDIDAVIER